MSCGGGHLGFPIGIKNTHLVEDSQTVHECSLDGPLQLHVFCSDMKFKMAATAGLSLTLDPMGKMFQNASSLKSLG
jgi:phage-related protein